MRRKIIIIIFCLLLPHILQAQTTLEERRVEEEKRESLKSSEPQEESSDIKPQPQTSSPKTPDQSKHRFFKKLLSQKMVPLSDGLYAVMYLLDKIPEHTDFSVQYNYLQSRHFLPSHIPENPHQPLTRGETAYLFYKSLNLKGGVLLKFFGTRQRWAHQELVFEKIMYSGSDQEYISGKEFVITFINAINYLTEQHAQP